MAFARTLPLPLATERLVLRELVESDLDAMHAYASQADVTQFLFWGPNSRADTVASLASFIASQRDDPRRVFELGLVERGQDGLIGALCLYLGDPETRRDAEIGFVLHPDFSGRGYVSEAAEALMRAGFDQLGLHRIWATCDTRNAASVRVLEKIGMRREGTLRACRKTAGGWADEHIYAALADDRR